ncbi:hypothetical protein RFW18_19045 [Metabacillus idriensis]|uniref:hypothetical protein n=1 Tax=Metabacillus idriensis TaxID=324768 RepID=UPI002813DCE0|nr:hypothetical protein [Metabacillus idriensis]MDR0139857.1 hypothetical protein [Metabacillus idriensis]
MTKYIRLSAFKSYLLSVSVYFSFLCRVKLMGGKPGLRGVVSDELYSCLKADSSRLNRDPWPAERLIRVTGSAGEN